MSGTYTHRIVGTTGHEILNPDGEVVVWAVDEITAAVIVALLNGAVRDALFEPAMNEMHKKQINTQLEVK